MPPREDNHNAVVTQLLYIEAEVLIHDSDPARALHLLRRVQTATARAQARLSPPPRDSRLRWSTSMRTRTSTNTNTRTRTRYGFARITQPTERGPLTGLAAPWAALGAE